MRAEARVELDDGTEVRAEVEIERAANVVGGQLATTRLALEAANRAVRVAASLDPPGVVVGSSGVLREYAT